MSPGRSPEAVAHDDGAARGRLLGGRDRRGDARRVPRPARDPPARARPARRRLGRRVRDLRLRPDRRRARARGASGRGRLDRRGRPALDCRRVPAGRERRSASSSTSTSRGRTPASAASPSTPPASGWACGSPQEAPVDADLVMPIPDSGTPAAIGFAKESGIPYEEGLDQEPLRRADVHPAGPGAAPAGDQAQVQPARRDRGQARGGRRRLDRPREHDAPARADALRRRRCRGARARLVAAGRLAVLLRDRHGRRGPARGSAPLGRGDARATSARRRSTTSRSRGCNGRPVSTRTRSAARASRATTRPACPSERNLAKLRFEPAAAL